MINTRTVVIFIIMMLLIFSTCFFIFQKKQVIRYLWQDLQTTTENNHLLIGTSSIKRLGDIYYCANAHWINRGFHNATLDDISQYLTLSPLDKYKTAILYLGENHLVKKQNVDETIIKYQSVISALLNNKHITSIVLIGIKFSPARKQYWRGFYAINQAMETFSALNSKVHYFRALKDNNPNYFVDDGVHLTALGYRYFLPDLALYC